MPKRFTDTNKWQRPWFRKLSPKMKLLWQYILDNCDVAGVWHVDVDMACFCIGEDISEDEAHEALAKQIEIIAGGSKWFVLDFIKYQYGKLSRDCRPHLPVIQALESHGIDINSVNQAEQHKYGSVTSKRRKEVIERDGNVCCYCGDEFADDALEPDHVVPKSRGGNDSTKNLVAACKRCNERKRDKHPAAFIRSLDDPEAAWKRLSERVPERLFNSLKDKDKEQEEEKEKEEDRRGSAEGETKPDAAPAAPVAEMLERLWESAPPIARQRSSRKQVNEAWRGLAPKPPPDDVLEAFEAWKHCHEWTRDGGSYVPGLHRWLKCRKFENPPKPNEGKPLVQPGTDSVSRVRSNDGRYGKKGVDL